MKHSPENTPAPALPNNPAPDLVPLTRDGTPCPITGLCRASLVRKLATAPPWASVLVTSHRGIGRRMIARRWLVNLREERP